MAHLFFISASSWHCSAQNDSCPRTSPPQSCAPTLNQPCIVSRREFSSLIAAASLTTVLAKPTASQACGECGPLLGLQDVLDRTFASCMESSMSGFEADAKGRKKQLFSMIPKESTIADIGIGTGPNLSMMPPRSTVIGIEPNPYMWPYAEAKSQEHNVSLKLVDGTCENIPMETASCDVAITTLTLCSVVNLDDGLREIKRIVRPGGLFIFVEHVIADPTRPILRTVQKALTPLQRVLASNCHFDRDIASSIHTTLGGSAKEIQIEEFEMSHASELEKNFSPIYPHITGYVRFSDILTT